MCLLISPAFIYLVTDCVIAKEAQATAIIYGIATKIPTSCGRKFIIAQHPGNPSAKGSIRQNKTPAAVFKDSIILFKNRFIISFSRTKIFVRNRYLSPELSDVLDYYTRDDAQNQSSQESDDRSQ